MAHMAAVSEQGERDRRHSGEVGSGGLDGVSKVIEQMLEFSVEDYRKPLKGLSRRALRLLHGLEQNVEMIPEV